jgi:hypothetical protein
MEKVESTQRPHQKLSDEQIVECINSLEELCQEIFQIQEDFGMKYQEINNVVEKLKMHYMPELFCEKKVPLVNLEEMFVKASGDHITDAVLRYSANILKYGDPEPMDIIPQDRKIDEQ